MTEERGDPNAGIGRGHAAHLRILIWGTTAVLRIGTSAGDDDGTGDWEATKVRIVADGVSLYRSIVKRYVVAWVASPAMGSRLARGRTLIRSGARQR